MFIDRSLPGFQCVNAIRENFRETFLINSKIRSEQAIAYFCFHTVNLVTVPLNSISLISSIYLTIIVIPFKNHPKGLKAYTWAQERARGSAIQLAVSLLSLPIIHEVTFFLLKCFVLDPIRKY